MIKRVADYEADLRRKLQSILHEVDAGGPCQHWPQAIGPNRQENYCVGCEIGNLAQGAMLDFDELLIEQGGRRASRVRMSEIEALAVLDDLIRRYEDGSLNYDDYDEACRLVGTARNALTLLEAQRAQRAHEGAE